MEDKAVKTIDFLRARLLAERSVSRTARQRAYELAKRVTELEKQLKYVSIQRKKAEKATVDVLAILENHGRNDLSEQFDSSSDQEEMSSQHVETSKVPESEFSSSEVESSRSLSWKSSKNSSSRYHEKKYTEASRRRRNNSFTSTGSSPRRVGKSCRQIRHRDREHRSAGDVSQNDDVANGHGENDDVANGHGVKNHGSEKDMERALENQAKFIARYEAEEKAQREWEDKFRENNGSPPDSCDPGTHSDVTEERDEIKAQAPVPPPPPPNDKNTPESQETDASFQEPKVNTEPLLDHTNTNDMDNKLSDNQNHPPDFQGTPPGHVSSPQDSSLYKGEQQISVKSYEQNIETPQNPSQLGSVLEALQQAKLSLKSLEKFPLLQNGPSVGPTYRSMDKFPLPFSSAGLFRLPIDYEYGEPTTTTRPNLTYDSRLSLTSQHTGPSGGQFGHFVSSPYTESLSSSSASLDDRFRMVPTFPYQETRLETGPVSALGVGPSACDPRLNVGAGPSGHDPRFDVGSGPFAREPRFDVGVGPLVRDPRLDVGLGPSARDPRFDVGLGQTARDPRLDVGLGQSARDPRFGVGPPVFDPRLEMGPSFTGDRYMRSGDSPLQRQSLYGDYMRPNTYK